MIVGNYSIILLYEYFYQRKYNAPSYQFKPTDKALFKIDDFLVRLDKQYNLHTLGKKFLSNYFIFQFNRTHKQVFNRFASRDRSGGIKVAGRIQIYDIIGKQAFQYWLDRDIKFDFILADSEFSKEYKISLLEINLLIDNEEEEKKSIIQAEEIEKKRFFNSSRGFLNCIEKTSLYNHRSVNCLVCQFRKDCKQMLQNNYSHIYIKRGYGASTH